MIPTWQDGKPAASSCLHILLCTVLSYFCIKKFNLYTDQTCVRVKSTFTLVVYHTHMNNGLCRVRNESSSQIALNCIELHQTRMSCIDENFIIRDADSNGDEQKINLRKWWWVSHDSWRCNSDSNEDCYLRIYAMLRSFLIQRNDWLFIHKNAAELVQTIKSTSTNMNWTDIRASIRIVLMCDSIRKRKCTFKYERNLIFSHRRDIRERDESSWCGPLGVSLANAIMHWIFSFGWRWKAFH